MQLWKEITYWAFKGAIQTFNMLFSYLKTDCPNRFTALTWFNIKVVWILQLKGCFSKRSLDGAEDLWDDVWTSHWGCVCVLTGRKMRTREFPVRLKRTGGSRRTEQRRSEVTTHTSYSVVSCCIQFCCIGQVMNPFVFYSRAPTEERWTDHLFIGGKGPHLQRAERL